MILRTTSHRSREKLQGVLGGRKAQFYWTFEAGGVFVKLDDEEEIKRALTIKGVNKARCQDEEKYGKCWS